MRFANLTEVAVELKKSNKKVQLLYAFNGTGKTRLSMAFKELVQSKNIEDETDDLSKKIIYFNAFTEDLFYWDNDLEFDRDRKLNINSQSSFMNFIFSEEGREKDIIDNFHRYTSSHLEPVFNPSGTEVAFNLLTNNEELQYIKISRGEESNFIWSIFYTLIKAVVAVRTDNKEDRTTAMFDNLEYIFIDDPISSLDDNHIIDVALDLASLIKKSNEESTGLKFILTTHHPLFYNVLYNELGGAVKHTLSKVDQNYELTTNPPEEDAPFAYHLMLVDELKEAIFEDRIEKYHFNLLRNLLEKTATFLGYKNWGDCVILKDEDGELEESAPYVRRINLHSHSEHSDYETRALTTQEKKVLERVFNQFLQNFNFNNVE